MKETTARLTTALADRYAIESEIDTGGMATVYRARDLKHDRTVAIKVLRPDLAQAIGADRFLREIRTTANLSHPHILPLHDSGEADGFLYYVMPFVQGESLADRLEREGELPVEDAVQIAREVAEALAYAHEEGVIHRDIKPANIMLERGHALLADFGIAQARAGAEETRLTGSGMSLGTPSYMSPEQITGEKEVDGRADQYALGCVLFEMLAGRPPFEGEGVETVLRQHLAVDAPRITGSRPTVPRGVANALHRSLAKTPADRYRSMGEFEKVLAGATLPLLARIPMGRARALIYAGTVVLGLATAAVIATVWQPGEGGAGAWRPDPRDIAVAPFVNRTGDPERDYGWLIAEDIRIRLERAEIGKTYTLDEVMGVLSQADPDADPFLVLTEQLGAGTVVTGHFGLLGDTLVITAYCRDGLDGHELSAIEPARGPASAQGEVIVEIRDRVAGVLAQYLEPDYRGRDLQRPPLNPEAFQAYRNAWEAQGGRDRDLAAVDLFLGAAKLDSTYMSPLIRAWFLIMFYNRAPESPRAAERDSLWVILDRSRHLMSGSQSRWMDWVRAEYQQPREPELALRVARRQYQSSAGKTPYELGFSAGRQNYLEEALEAFQRWDKGNGEFVEGFADYNYFYDYSQVLMRLGLHEKALEVLEVGHRLFPEALGPRNPILKRFGLRPLVALGRLDEADSVAAELPRDGSWMYQDYPSLLTYYGHEDRARSFLEGEVARFESDPYYRETPLARAGVLSFLGRQEDALAILEPLAAQDPQNMDVLSDLGLVAARMGDTARAHAIDQQLAQIPSVQREPWARVFIAAALGERERALEFMKQIPPTQGLWFWFRILPEFGSFQGWEPYEEFMRPKT